jgi:DNA-binding transcriptional ArsR family regulator
MRYVSIVNQTFAALAAPNRLRIVELLRDGPRPVAAIGEALRLGQPQVSKQLGVLRAARLVEVEARGQQRLYRLRAQPLRALDAWVERYRCIWEERLDSLEALVEKLDARERKNRRKR